MATLAAIRRMPRSELHPVLQHHPLNHSSAALRPFRVPRLRCSRQDTAPEDSNV